MRNRDIIIILAGAYLCITSFSVIAGRLTGVRWLFDWGDGVGMAYTTALNLAVVGGALILVGCNLRK